MTSPLPGPWEPMFDANTDSVVAVRFYDVEKRLLAAKAEGNGQWTVRTPDGEWLRSGGYLDTARAAGLLGAQHGPRAASAERFAAAQEDADSTLRKMGWLLADAALREAGNLPAPTDRPPRIEAAVKAAEGLAHELGNLQIKYPDLATAVELARITARVLRELS